MHRPGVRPNDLFEIDTTPLEQPAVPAQASTGSGEGGVGSRPVPAAGLSRAWARSSGTAPAAAPRSGSSAASTAAVRAGPSARPRRRRSARAAGSSGSCRTRPAGASCAPGAAAGAAPGRPAPEDTLCRDCRREARQSAAQRPCPRCGRPGYLREATGWCGPFFRPRQQKDPPRECTQCGQVKRHAGLGMCSACFQRRPDRAFQAGAGLAARLASPPDWLDGFTAHLAGAYSPARACQLITALGRLLGEDGQPAHPQALIERARWPGRSIGPLARGLETFFTEHGLALADRSR